MRVRVALMLGFIGTACSDPQKANGTAFFVVAQYDGGLPITQLFITGRLPAGSDLFKPSYRPEDAGSVLPSPQSVRVLLLEGFGGSAVDVDVAGYSAVGEAVAYGSTKATIVDGLEVTVVVPLAPPIIIVVPADAGSSPDGGVVTGSCPAECSDSCCIHVGGVPHCASDVSMDVRKFICGKPQQTCLACDPLAADGCIDGRGCVCGDGGACGPGLLCHQGHCLCAPESCIGCCTAEGACVSGDDKDACGSGGLRCEACLSSGPGSGSCSGGVCAGNPCVSVPMLRTKCLSGNDCVDAGVLPFCSNGSGGAGNLNAGPCEACNFHRADTCSASGGCICGGSGRECFAGQLCGMNGCAVAPDELGLK